MKIAIVGNSGSILKYKYGDLIDTYGRVVRFNIAPIEGFEKQVGRKRDIRFICYKPEYNYSEIKDEFVRLYSYKFKLAVDALNLLVDYNDVTILPDNFIQQCDNLIGKPYWKWWLKKKLGFDRTIIHKRMSTTGLKAIVWALDKGYGVSLFGFTQDQRFHYYQENRPGYNVNDSHDLAKEMQIIKGFENEGKLKIFS